MSDRPFRGRDRSDPQDAAPGWRSAARRSWIGTTATVLVALIAGAVQGDEFDESIAPLLARRCLGCHNRTDQKGGLDLSSSKSSLAGGDSGPAFVPGQRDASRLWKRISNDEMPPKKPLTDEEKQRLGKWLAEGAIWGADPIDPFRFSSDLRAGYDWWSLQPVRRAPPPPLLDDRGVINDIDRYIRAALPAQGLAPAPPASPRTLIRRLSFDLLGLPPDPETVAAFLADQKPGAYDRLVERFLESPHYGERWGRHWLDVVRFGESQGFERDKLRTSSWPYRDWVIDAFNRDLPYNEFVRWQIAGDVLHPNDPRGVIATGFLVAGPWDEVGQSQQSAAMKAVVRQDELEDMIGVTCQTFLGLTAHCARCHDHKFDPISYQEYYALAAALAGVRHGERDALQGIVRGELAEQVATLRDKVAELERRLAALDAPVRDRILAERRQKPAPLVALPRPLARWEFDGDLQDAIGSLHGTAQGKARVEGGRLVLDGQESYVVTAPLAKDLSQKTLEAWVTLSNLEQQGGAALSVESTSGAVFDAIVYGEREPGQWMAGSNGFSRTQSFQGAKETEFGDRPVQMVIVYDSNRTVTCYRNGRLYGQSYQAPALAVFEGGKSHVLLGLRHSPPGGNRLLAASIDRAAIYDRALSAEEVAALAGVVSEHLTTDQLLAGYPAPLREERERLSFELSRLRTELGLRAPGKAYAVAPTAPEATFALERGDPRLKREPALPGGIRALAPLPADFALEGNAPDALRRIKLADWIADPRNPLTPRVIANRLWQYHFGTGLVETPNDFGFNGGRPSHPELLDFLAAQLQENHWSLKHLHRLIVRSATYRQSSQGNAAALRVDSHNRWLWRRAPQRLEAEAVRDAILTVAGQLNPSMGGPGYQDFRTFTFNSQFYEMLDPVGFEFQRRTVYRTWVRSGRNEFLDVFDCPDPSTTAPRRAVTTTPLQALALLNNSFTLRMADDAARRVAADAGEEAPRQVARLYELAYSRPSSEDELQSAVRFISEHGLAALCRVVFNSNEFLYID
ncbi:MAG: DUF1553 domain-containing protein [Planctomycetales bacterium]